MDHFGDRDIDAFEAWKMFNPKPQAEGLRGMEWDGSRVPQMGYHPHPSTIHGWLTHEKASIWWGVFQPTFDCLKFGWVLAEWGWGWRWGHQRGVRWGARCDTWGPPCDERMGQRSYDIFGWVLFFSFGGPSHQDNHRDLASKRFPALGVALAQESLWQLSTRALTTPIRTCAIPCGWTLTKSLATASTMMAMAL